MCQFDPPLTLKELLRHCSDPGSEHYNDAWEEFMTRYKMFMYRMIGKRCHGFNVPRLKLGYSETVNDILEEVFLKLIGDKSKALRDFRAPDDENRFYAYLTTICQHMTSRFIHKHIASYLVEKPAEEVYDYYHNLSQEHSWMVYEDLIQCLRETAGPRKDNLERDIHIFMLRTCAQFSKQMVFVNPCLNKIENHTIDVIINRMRGSLRKK